jgi:glutathione S-transferase
MGERFGVADAYLFTVTNWGQRLQLDLSEFPALLAFQQRVAERPAVLAAMREEELIK